MGAAHHDCEAGGIVKDWGTKRASDNSVGRTENHISGDRVESPKVMRPT